VARIITRLNIGGPAIQAISLSHDLLASGFETCLIHGRLSSTEGDMTRLMPIGATEAAYVPALVRQISPLSDLRAFWRIYRVLCRWQPDIVHTHMAKAGAVGRLAALLYNRTRGTNRSACLIHTYHGHVFEGYFGSFSTRVFLLVERWLGRRTDTLIAISPQIKHELLETYLVAREEQIRLIPLGFNLDRLTAIGSRDRERARASLDIPQGSVVVTTVGRLTGIKQHSLFLEMASRLARRSNGFLFLIAGDGELRGELEARAKAFGISSSVQFLGWRGDLDQVYGATDVFVLTSRNEGTPVALIEAMASGVASVSTDVGGVRDVITEPALGALVPFGDADGLADAVMRFAESPVLRQHTGEAARRAVCSRFDVKRLVADISGLYRQLLSHVAAGKSSTIA
jgi:glycosyltransferase involved in cell wall biosynthesis